jgi:hypothetical protein
MSSIGGSGSGGNVGGPQQPSITELEQQAIVQVNRQMLGITPDTLDMTFSQLGDRTFRNYKSDSGHPSLPQMGTVRSGKEMDHAPDDSWKPFYNALFQSLPEDMQNMLLAQKLLPAAEQDPNCQELEAVLVLGAQAQAFIQGVSQAVDTEGVANQTAINANLPETAAQGLIVLGNQIVSEGNQLIEQLGPNDPNTDNLTNLVNEIGLAVSEMS